MNPTQLARASVTTLAASDLKGAIRLARQGFSAARKASEATPTSGALLREMSAWRALRDALLESATAADL